MITVLRVYGRSAEVSDGVFDQYQGFVQAG